MGASIYTTYICPRASQIYNLGTAIPVLLEARALEAVERVGDALAAADDALVLVVAKAALVADAHEGRGAHVGVAHGTLAVALVAEAADGDAGLLAAHDEVAGGGGEVLAKLLLLLPNGMGIRGLTDDVETYWLAVGYFTQK